MFFMHSYFSNCIIIINSAKKNLLNLILTGYCNDSTRLGRRQLGRLRRVRLRKCMSFFFVVIDSRVDFNINIYIYVKTCFSSCVPASLTCGAMTQTLAISLESNGDLIASETEATTTDSNFLQTTPTITTLTQLTPTASPQKTDSTESTIATTASTVTSKSTFSKKNFVKKKCNYNIIIMFYLLFILCFKKGSLLTKTTTFTSNINSYIRSQIYFYQNKKKMYFLLL